MFKQIKGKKLYEEVIEQIKNLLDEGKLKNEDVLPSVEEMAKNIGVSRSTVREALVVLEAIGIVQSVRGKGAVIKTSDNTLFNTDPDNQLLNFKNTLYYIQEFNLTIEPSIAKLVVKKADEEDLERLKNNLNEMEKYLDKEGEEEILGQLSLLFHKILMESTKNPIIAQLFSLTEEIEKSNRKIVFKSRRETKDTYMEHKRIYEAIKKRDEDEAFACMQNHLLKLREYLTETF